MRRTLEALDVSVAIEKTPISPVERTWVPPQSSPRNCGQAVADLDHSHLVAVLLAEQRHRAELLGLVAGGDDRVDVVVVGDPAVDAVLDGGDVLRRQRLAVREVEAKLVRANGRSRLTDVVAEPLAQRGVQQVGCGVMRRGRESRVFVDGRADGLALLECALGHLDGDDLVVTDPVDVDDLAAGAVGLERAGVRDLASALCVEDAFTELEDHLAGRARLVLDRDDRRGLRRGRRSRRTR